MAYTRPWSNLNPLGTAAASTIDDEIRNVRVDTQERMDTLLGAGKWATDPIAVLSGIKKFIHGASGADGSDVASTYSNSNTGKRAQPGAGGSASIVIPFQLPIGATITDVTAFFENGFNSINTGLVVQKIAVVGAAATTLGATPSISTVGEQSLSTGALTEVVADNFVYVATITTSDTGAGVGYINVHALRVTYTKANIVQ